MINKFNFEGKIVLVTGGSRGIGSAIVNAFVNNGAKVVSTSRNPKSSEEKKRVTNVAWDISEVEMIPERLKEIKEQLGGLDIVINNAGVLSLPKDYSGNNFLEDNWDYVIDINLKAAYFLCRKSADLLAESNGGIIVNIASDAGFRPAGCAYGLSKMGVVGFTAGLSKSYAQKGVRINAVAPGPVSTTMMGCEDGHIQEAANLPLGRYSTPEDIADVTLLLASDAARAVHGQALVVNSSN